MDPVVVALATKHKDPKSFLGYIEASPGSPMAADPAVAAKSSRCCSRFVGGIDLDLPIKVVSVNPSLSSSSSSSSPICFPIFNVQENVVLQDCPLLLLVLCLFRSPEMFIIFIH